MGEIGSRGEQVRIAMLAIGTLGDVQPCVALGLGFQEAGDRVCIAAHPSFEGFVRSRGLEFAPVVPEVLSTEVIRDRAGRRDNRANELAYVVGMQKYAARVMRERVLSAWQACEGAQAIIASPLAILAGYHIAEKLSVPLIRAYMAPWTPTGDYPANFIPAGWSLGSPLNRMSHRFALQLLWLFLRFQANAARREVLDLPPLPLREPFRMMDRKRMPVLYGYSPAFAPPPDDWGEAHHVTGYWWLSQSSEWQPPTALEEFLASGPPPVYVGFGSMTNPNAQEVAELVVAALAQAGARGVLLTGLGGLDKVKVSDHVYALESAPHEWLLPRMALAVHHGGGGTVAACLCADLPMIIVPFLPDHLFWGRRAYELGIGPRPIPRQRLTADRLADAIRATLDDPRVKQNAETLGKRIRAEDGVAKAVEVVHAHLGRQAYPTGSKPSGRAAVKETRPWQRS